MNRWGDPVAALERACLSKRSANADNASKRWGWTTVWLVFSITVVRAMWVASGTRIAYSDRSDGRGACAGSDVCGEP
jgi:hypothetical protein